MKVTLITRFVFMLITLLLLSCLSLSDLFYQTNQSVSYSTLFYSVFGSAAYLTLTALLWPFRYSRPISMIMLLLWCINITISLSINYVYHSSPNPQIMLALLTTNRSEINAFITTNWDLIAFLFFIYMAILWFIPSLSTFLRHAIPTNLLQLIGILVYIPFLYSFVVLVKSYQIFQHVPTVMVIDGFFMTQPLENFIHLNRAAHELSLMNRVNGFHPHYQLHQTDQGIDVYVIVIGESARRHNLHLYGYPRPTTPYLNKAQDNLLLFTQAVASGTITTMTVPSTLSNKGVNSTDVSLLGDNIIAIANQAGFKTYWYSTQDKIGRYDTPITLIATHAQQKEWRSNKFDGVLINDLKLALADKVQAKKLIILHLLGSHSNSCYRYPEEESFFVGGAIKDDDCYDNSIRYTDKILGQIIELLQPFRSSLLYYSDHGQVRLVKNKTQVVYQHDITVPPKKEAFDVPQFIWYNKKLLSMPLGMQKYEAVYDTADNYYLIQDWLGLQQVGQYNEHSVLSENFQPRDKITVFDILYNPFDYLTLKSEYDH